MPCYLYWLRLPERVNFKVAVITFRVLYGLGPSYLNELVLVADTPCLRGLLSPSSASSMDSATSKVWRWPHHHIYCTIHHSVGRCSFPVAAFILCNSLPPCIQSSPALATCVSPTSKNIPLSKIIFLHSNVTIIFLPYTYVDFAQFFLFKPCWKFLFDIGIDWLWQLYANVRMFTDVSDSSDNKLSCVEATTFNVPRVIWLIGKLFNSKAWWLRVNSYIAVIHLSYTMCCWNEFIHTVFATVRNDGQYIMQLTK